MPSPRAMVWMDDATSRHVMCTCRGIFQHQGDEGSVRKSPEEVLQNLKKALDADKSGMTFWETARGHRWDPRWLSEG